MKSIPAALIFFLTLASPILARAQVYAPPVSASAAAPLARIRVGGNVAAAKLIVRVQPVYPQLARQARISGTVRLHVIIDEGGGVYQVEVISGHPVLVQAAIDAVRQWRYESTVLNGHSVEVDTTIDVIFALAENGTVAGSADSILKRDILHFFEVSKLKEQQAETANKALENMRLFFLESLPATPNHEKIVDEYTQSLANLMQTDEFTERAAAVYARYLSDDDVKALTQFAETPAGQHFYLALPKLFVDLSQVGRQMAMEHVPDVLNKICSEYPELAGAPHVCPGSDPTKPRPQI